MTTNETEPCQVGCTPICRVCQRIKKPVWRRAPTEWDGCDDECSGYRDEPTPCDLWPGEQRGTESSEELCSFCGAVRSAARDREAAVREEALEEAAKLFDGGGEDDLVDAPFVAAEIRALKERKL